LAKSREAEMMAKTGRIILLMLILGLFPYPDASAQLSKLQIGQDHFMNGSYEKALEYFNQAIDQDKNVPADMLSEAYYLRGLTYVRLYNQAYSGDNAAGQKYYRDALLSAYNDFKSSIEHDDGQMLSQIDLEVKNLHHALLEQGLSSLNSYNDLVYNGKKDPDLLKRALDYLAAAHEIKETYLACDLLGQVYLDKGMKTEAAGYFTRSEQLYKERLPEMPDFLMAYVFYRLAAIHKDQDMDLALDDYQRGYKLMESEYQRFNRMKNDLEPDQASLVEGQYRLAAADLNNLKLDLYLSQTGQYAESLHIFEAELAKNPSDVNTLIGYASLLEKVDADKAIFQYQKVLGLDSLNAIALYNLGALNYARGKQLFEAAQLNTGSPDHDKIISDAMESFRAARPYFEKALAIEPGSLETVVALKTIAFVMDDKKAYRYYEELESKMQK
jgi:tetratricopeptide (TPR) repeat protein